MKPFINQISAPRTSRLRVLALAISALLLACTVTASAARGPTTNAAEPSGDKTAAEPSGDKTAAEPSGDKTDKPQHQLEQRWFGRAGQLVVGFENLLTFSATHVTTPPPPYLGPDLVGAAESSQIDPDPIDPSSFTSKSAQFSLLGLGAGHAYGGTKLSFDGFLPGRVSLGGAVAFAVGAQRENGAETDGVALHLRAGAAFAGDSFAFWPRAGVAFLRQSTEYSFYEVSASATAFVVETCLAWVVGEGRSIALLLTPAVYLPLSGHLRAHYADGFSGSELDVSTRTFSLSVGILAMP